MSPMTWCPSSLTLKTGWLLCVSFMIIVNWGLGDQCRHPCRHTLGREWGCCRPETALVRWACTDAHLRTVRADGKTALAADEGGVSGLQGGAEGLSRPTLERGGCLLPRGLAGTGSRGAGLREGFRRLWSRQLKGLVWGEPGCIR